MNTIFLSDLDGTLLNEAACLPPDTRRRLERLLTLGLPLTVATGRTPLSVGPIFQGLPMAVPWVLMNGALIYSPGDGAILDHTPLGEDALEGLIRSEEALGLRGLLLGTAAGQLHVTLGGTWSPLWQAFFRRNHLSDRLRPRRGRAADWAGGHLLYGIYLHPRLAPLEALGAELTAWGGLQVEVYRDVYDPNTCCLELYSAAASKGAAAQALRRLTGARRLVAFGDGANDLSLFQACDECYAVSNARPEVRAAATGVIGSCRAGGVVRYLEGRLADGSMV